MNSISNSVGNVNEMETPRYKEYVNDKVALIQRTWKQYKYNQLSWEDIKWIFWLGSGAWVGSRTIAELGKIFGTAWRAVPWSNK